MFENRNDYRNLFLLIIEDTFKEKWVDFRRFHSTHNFGLVMPMSMSLFLVSEATIFANSRAIVDIIELDELSWMSKSSTSSITHSSVTIHFNDRNFINQFFGITAMLAKLILKNIIDQ